MVGSRAVDWFSSLMLPNLRTMSQQFCSWLLVKSKLSQILTCNIHISNVLWSLCIRPAVTELHNTEQVERVRKEKNVCFFLVTSNENSQLSEKIKVIFESIVGWVCWKTIMIIRFDYEYNIEYWYMYDSGIWGKWYEFLNSLSPNIHIQILQTGLYTFPLRISWENLIKDQGIFSLVIIL